MTARPAENASKPRGWTILYCGADMPWEDLQSHGFRRRNTCLVQALARRPEIDRIYLVNSVTRAKYQERMGRAQPLSGPASDQHASAAPAKVIDLYVTRALPERPWAPWLARLNRRLAARALRKQLPTLDPDRTILWCYWPAAYKLAKLLGLGGKLVFDADNDLISCPNMRQTRPDFASVMEEISGRAAAIVCGSPALLEWCSARGAARASRLRNGVDLSRFNPPENASINAPNAPAEAAPNAVAALPRPHIGYVGTISRWMDFELLERLAARRPDWTFVMIGKPYLTEIPPAFLGRANVHWPGPLPAGEVPAAMRAFDVGIVPYLFEDKLGGADTDSMKVYEYLAAGIPVVAAPFHGHIARDYAGLVDVASGAENFHAAIERALALAADEKKAAWDARRIEFLAQNTWDARALEVIELLETLS